MNSTSTKLTEKQKRFCDFYIIDPNATASAVKAGYSERTAKSIGQRLLTNVDIQEYIGQRNGELSSTRAADIVEVKEYWTKIMRNEGIPTRDRLKASELLAKSYGAFITKLEHSGDEKNPIQHRHEFSDLIEELNAMTPAEIDSLIASINEEIKAGGGTA